MNNLPQIIIPTLSSVLSASSNVSSPPKLQNVEKPFIILITRDLTKNEKKQFEKMGSTIYWHQMMPNINLLDLYNEFKFDFFVLDLRDLEQHKYYDNNSEYHNSFTIICLCCFYEQYSINDCVCDVENSLCELPVSPVPSAFKRDLLKQPINPINNCTSICTFIINILSNLSKK